MKYRIQMLRRAHADFASTVAYLYERSPQGAAAWVNAFEKANARLAGAADSCSEADENYRFDIDVKQMLFKTRRGRVYRLIFTIVDDEVRILRVRGPGQASVNPDDV
jgi:plasmid stabilization system protein ParE